VRGKSGAIELVHGAHVLPDSNAHGHGESPQWLYTVAFAGRDVWGPQVDPTLTVSTDCWESYLEPA
jgi:nitrile hydratase